MPQRMGRLACQLSVILKSLFCGYARISVLGEGWQQALLTQRLNGSTIGFGHSTRIACPIVIVSKFFYRVLIQSPIRLERWELLRLYRFMRKAYFVSIHGFGEMGWLSRLPRC